MVLYQTTIQIDFFRWNELVVTGLFLTVVILWITRDLGGGGRGWSVLLPQKYVLNQSVLLFFVRFKVMYQMAQ
jgi:hypothetical protein